MSLLKRYRKPGGFEQLRELLENSTPDKLEQLLGIITNEDEAWAKLLRTKILTVHKMFSWEPTILAEVTTRVPERILAIALHGLDANAVGAATYTMNNIKQKEIYHQMEAIKPSKAEIAAAWVKLIQQARQLDQQGVISLEDMDPSLRIMAGEIAS